MKQSLLSVMILFCMNTIAYGHGFSGDTLVQLAGKSWQRIHTVCERAVEERVWINSFNFKTGFQESKIVKRSGQSRVNCYIRFGFREQLKNDIHNNEIICTPTQEFYLANEKRWVQAYTLKIGDELLCAQQDNIGTVTKKVAYLQCVNEPIPIYTLEVSYTHTFFVSADCVLTHNMVLPAAFSLGFVLPFGAGGAVAGGFFGPITLVASIAVGCIVGAFVKIVCTDKVPHYTINMYDVDHVYQYTSRNNNNEHSNILSIEAYEETTNNLLTDSCTIVISPNPIEKSTGCGDTTPKKPITLITPGIPVKPLVENSGHSPLPEEKKEELNGGCKGIPISQLTKEDLYITMTIEDAQKRWAKSD